MKKLISTALAALAVVGAAPVLADTYPSRPVTLIAPFPPGGSTDVLARILATRLGARLGQPVVIENKPGANGSIGASAAARAKPDGYTILLMGGSSYTVNSLLYKNMGYDPLASYEYLGIAGGTQLVMLTNPTTGIASIKDVVTKSATEPLSFGSFGTGSLPHIAGEYFSQKTGAKLVHVPYKGSAPAMTDLIGNQIPLTIETMVAAMPQIRGGKVKPVAVLGAKRAVQLPDVPTMQESGVSDFDFETWFGIVAPKGTPADVVDRLSRELKDMMAEKATHEALDAAGFDPRYSDARQFRDQVQRELKRNARIIEAAKIHAD
ncbi:tripartite tricarboxylate transporter substrate binding protein [Xylophilus sp. GOD-11R]|uniref:Bug family tripartite tricarboxylate transporter substrate binding protein n=1 Tax=Xylophilus sp. GOD-11R TaxID=3089814 RepID=UPI00298C6343|nr:tripartite tricarboxylate transporter substrate binding protein [Xylophilus sp. GOD-11R]WPB58902.1 tripartite tricarboxylate transporter substrate binding protein [Xylophilus sp. GOD-11R]